MIITKFSKSLLRKVWMGVDWEKFHQNCKFIDSVINAHVENLSALQKEVWAGIWTEKIANDEFETILIGCVSRFTKSVASGEIAEFVVQLEHCFELWKECRSKIRSLRIEYLEKYSTIPARLAFAFLIHGEIAKGVVCLTDMIQFINVPSLKLDILMLLISLGEIELVASKLMGEWYYLENDCDVLCNLIYYYIIYVKNPRQREDMRRRIDLIRCSLADACRDCDRIETVKAYAYSLWISSLIASDPTKNQLPQQLYYLHAATELFKYITKSIYTAFDPFEFNKNVDSFSFEYAFFPTRRGNNINVSIQYIRFALLLTWHTELTREMTEAFICAGMHSETTQLLRYNCLVSLRIASPFMVMRSLNMSLNYHLKLKDLQSKLYAKMYKMLLINLLSPRRSVSNFRIDGFSKFETPISMMHAIVDEMSETFGDKTLHLNEKSCPCFSCCMYQLSTSYAAEFMQATMACANFSEDSMFLFQEEFVKIQHRGLTDMCRVFGDGEVESLKYISKVYVDCVNRYLVQTLASQKGKFEISIHVEMLLKTALEISEDLTINDAVNRFILEQLIREFNYRSKNPSSTPIYKDLVHDIQKYQHLLHSEWRSRIFKFFANAHGLQDTWVTAFGFIEAVGIGERNRDMVKEVMEQSETLDLFPSQKPSGFRLRKAEELVENVIKFPKERCILMLVTSNDGDLYLCKIHGNYAPIVVPLMSSEQVDEIMRELARVSRNSDEEEMRAFYEIVEKEFLGSFVYLLTPSTKVSNSCATAGACIERLTNKGVSQGEATEFIHLTRRLERDLWQELVERFCHVRSVDREMTRKLVDRYDYCVEAAAECSTPNKNECCYLLISPEIADFRWEQLPSLECLDLNIIRIGAYQRIYYQHSDKADQLFYWFNEFWWRSTIEDAEQKEDLEQTSV